MNGTSAQMINKVSSKKIHNTDLPRNSNILNLPPQIHKTRTMLTEEAFSYAVSWLADGISRQLSNSNIKNFSRNHGLMSFGLN